jgi:hypothetical protein
MEQSIVVLKRDCTGPVARRQKTLAKCVIAYRVRYKGKQPQLASRELFWKLDCRQAKLSNNHECCRTFGTSHICRKSRRLATCRSQIRKTGDLLYFRVKVALSK